MIKLDTASGGGVAVALDGITKPNQAKRPVSKGAGFFCVFIQKSLAQSFCVCDDSGDEYQFTKQQYSDGGSFRIQRRRPYPC